jgi:hypothetical protein
MSHSAPSFSSQKSSSVPVSFLVLRRSLDPPFPPIYTSTRLVWIHILSTFYFFQRLKGVSVL